MKTVLLTLLFTMSLLSDDAIKGQTYYMYLLKDKLGYNGAVLSKKYTQKQWQAMFDNNAQEFKQFLTQQNPELKTFTQSKKFKKITPFLEAFVTSYAKDVKNAPLCE